MTPLSLCLRFGASSCRPSATKLLYQACRTKYYHNRHRDPKYRRERARKVWRIDLPDFDQQRLDDKRLSPEEIRSKLKEKGVAPPNPWNEREIFQPCSMATIEPFQPPEGDWQASSLLDKMKNPISAGKDLIKSRRYLGAIRTYEGDEFDLDQFARKSVEIYRAALGASATIRENLSSNITKYSSPILSATLNLSASRSRPMLQHSRQFHARGSKIHYLDFRYRFRTNLHKLNMLIIRRQKMKKHKRRKFRRKFKCLLAKKRLKREIAKEKAFRVELLTIIRRAENFDPREYALNKIAEINNRKPEPTKEERLEELKGLIRKHRYQTHYIKPKHRKACY